MPKPVIAIDIDDTIAESTESLRLMVNERTGADISFDAYRVAGDYWGYYERVWEAHGVVNQFKYSDYEQEMVKDQSFVPLLPGAQFAIGKLLENYKVILITARHPSWESVTRDWLVQAFPGASLALYFSRSHAEADGITKGKLCAQLSACLLIDDSIEHCRSAMTEGIQSVLFGEYGWQVNAEKDMTRCRDWQAVLDYVDAR